MSFAVIVPTEGNGAWPYPLSLPSFPAFLTKHFFTPNIVFTFYGVVPKYNDNDNDKLWSNFSHFFNDNYFFGARSNQLV